MSDTSLKASLDDDVLDIVAQMEQQHKQHAGYKAGVTRKGGHAKSNNSSSTSGSSECSSEEVRRLFQACDRDGDGYIDREDLLEMCRQLNMEDSVEEIMAQLGVVQHGRISFHDFLRCRMQLIAEIEHERLREQRLSLSGVQSQQNDNDPDLHGASDNRIDVPPNYVYDSGAHGLISESPSLFNLLRTHHAELLEQCQNNDMLVNLLDVSNSLHVAALTPLKREVVELNAHLQHISAAKEQDEKQLYKYQSDKLGLQRVYQQRLEEQAVRYEDRITELHSVIAELQKKLDRSHINTIREEDEDQYEESDGLQSDKSPEDISLNENNANESQSASVAEIGIEINAELSRVVSELELAINENCEPSDHVSDVLLGRLTCDRYSCSTEDKAIQVCDPSTYVVDMLPANVAGVLKRAKVCEHEMSSLQQHTHDLQEQIARQEMELNKIRAQYDGSMEERDRLKRKVRELQTRIQNVDTVSPRRNVMSTPTKQYTASPPISYTDVTRRDSSTGCLDQQVTPVSKVAELKKIKTWTTSQPHVMAPEIMTNDFPITGKVVEHLVQNLKESSDVQELAQSVNKHGTGVSEAKVQEFEIEVERLQSKIDHYKSQLDLTNFSLTESKSYCDRLTVLMGKYESNQTAFQLTLNFCDQALETYQVLVSLLDSENSVLIANCRAAGIGAYGVRADVDRNQEDLTNMVQNALRTRRSAEGIAKQMMLRIDLSNPSVAFSPQPWEDLSSNSRNTSTASSTTSSLDSEWTKAEEQKLRDIIQQLQAERSLVKTTVLELESVHIDPMLHESPGPSSESHKIDLENAVLIQELMAVKEERAELKSQNYVLDKEKSSVELQLFALQCKEMSVHQHVKSLQAELAERNSHHDESVSPSITIENLKSLDQSEITHELQRALQREKALKLRIKELLTTLEYMSQNSEYRHQQSSTFVNDLKKANSALIEAFERAKKKYQAKVKKLECQLQSMKTKYERQVGSLMHTIHQIKAESTHKSTTSETSL